MKRRKGMGVGNSFHFVEVLEETRKKKTRDGILCGGKKGTKKKKKRIARMLYSLQGMGGGGGEKKKSYLLRALEGEMGEKSNEGKGFIPTLKKRLQFHY